MSKSDAFLQAGKTAVLQNIHGTMQFLQRFPPFNHMENTHLAFLVEQCQLRFYGPGESIIRPADGPVEHVEVYGKALNAFKASYLGSAKNVTIKFHVKGGLY